VIRFLLTALAAAGFLVASATAQPTKQELRDACVPDVKEAVARTLAKPSKYLTQSDAAVINGCASQVDAFTVEAPPPPPPPPPPPQTVELVSKPVYRAALIVPDFFYPMCGERYNRSPSALELTGPTWRSSMFGNADAMALCSVDQEAGGRVAPWLHPTIALEIGGVEVARGNPVEGRNYLRFDRVPVPDLPDGWYIARAVAYDAAGARVDLGARAPENWVLLNRNGTAKDLDHFIVQSGNYDYVRMGGPVHRWAKVQKSLIAAKPKPLAPRPIVPFDAVLAADQIWRTNLLPSRQENIYRPVVTASGATVAANRQGYFFNDVYAAVPRLPQLDGPRGVGSVYMATDIKVSRRDGHHHVYVNYGSGVARIEPDGHRRTLFGYRQTRPTHWPDAAKGVNTELVGDWQVEPKGMVDSWGFDFVPSTLATNDNAPPVGGEQPHLVGPQALAADPVHDRVLKVTFAPDDRLKPPVITLCASFPGGDPWDLAIGADDVAYITLRKQSVIARVNARTCERLPDLAANDTPIGIFVDTNRVAHATAGTLEQRRAAKVLGPEGICLDSAGNVVVGASAQEAVWTYDKATGARSFRAFPPYSTSAKSAFTKVACGRGGFGPRDVIAVTTWSESYHGRPHLFLPVDANGVAKGWDFHRLGWTVDGHTPATSSGTPGGTRGGIYAAAAGFGPGMLVTSSAEEGLQMFSRRLPTDVIPDIAAYKRGFDRYVSKGYRLLHGEDGYSFLNLPLPCNEDPDITVYLKANGHCG
jgi:hypothetical protein